MRTSFDFWYSTDRNFVQSACGIIFACFRFLQKFLTSFEVDSPPQESTNFYLIDSKIKVKLPRISYSKVTRKGTLSKVKPTYVDLFWYFECKIWFSGSSFTLTGQTMF